MEFRGQLTVAIMHRHLSVVRFGLVMPLVRLMRRASVADEFVGAESLVVRCCWSMPSRTCMASSRRALASETVIAESKSFSSSSSCCCCSSSSKEVETVVGASLPFVRRSRVIREKYDLLWKRAGAQRFSFALNSSVSLNLRCGQEFIRFEDELIFVFDGLHVLEGVIDTQRNSIHIDE